MMCRERVALGLSSSQGKGMEMILTLSYLNHKNTIPLFNSEDLKEGRVTRWEKLKSVHCQMKDIPP